MSDVRSGQKETALTHNGLRFRYCPPVDRNVLAQNGPLAYPAEGPFAVVFHVLRGVADDYAGMEFTVLRYVGPSGQENALIESAARGDTNVSLDYTIRADLDGAIQFRLGIDDRSGVDCQDTLLLTVGIKYYR